MLEFAVVSLFGGVSPTPVAGAPLFTEASEVVFNASATGVGLVVIVVGKEVRSAKFGNGAGIEGRFKFDGRVRLPSAIVPENKEKGSVNGMDTIFQHHLLIIIKKTWESLLFLEDFISS